MSASDEGKDANLPSKYDVGYGKPPAQYRFQKGQSGNPSGRPKGSRNKAPVLNPNDRPTDSLILQEAYRTVTVREGDKMIELPAIQASTRALAISAMKGSRLAQKQLSDMVRNIENKRHNDQASLLEAMLEYKQRWTAELARRKRVGSNEPDPIPHPDDIVLSIRKGTVVIEGPADEAEKQFWDQRFERMDDAQSEINHLANKHRRCRDAEMKSRYLESLHIEQYIFDVLNDSLPERHKRKLENRSYAAGASREGKTLQNYRK